MYEFVMKNIDQADQQRKIESLLLELDPDAEVSFDVLESKLRVETAIPFSRIEDTFQKQGIAVNDRSH